MLGVASLSKKSRQLKARSVAESFKPILYTYIPGVTFECSNEYGRLQCVGYIIIDSFNDGMTLADLSRKYEFHEWF